MVIIGGYLDGGKISDEILTMNLETRYWNKVEVKGQIEGFA